MTCVPGIFLSNGERQGLKQKFLFLNEEKNYFFVSNNSQRYMSNTYSTEVPFI